ncbi:MAG: 50S ribosomal protein L15 [candidate division Zixibacteria bacterium]|nr:50S ribosomal protein L15 [candidate division Zixibacteria bacterium]
MRAKFPYKKRPKRVGCGTGSGHGKTGTRGQKGQKSRSGVSYRVGFEGGQNPLYRRLPKRGFNNNAFRTFYSVINLESIASLEEKEVTPEVLVSHGMVKKNRILKVLGKGDLKKAVTVRAHRFSESARAKIEKAGGKAFVIGDQNAKIKNQNELPGSKANEAN